MEKYKRVNPKITDLNPDKVSGIFVFLEALFEDHNLSIDYFKYNLYQFSVAQQYFILKYAKEYFNLDSESSFISKRLLSLERDIDSQKEEDVFNTYKQVIISNSQILLVRIDQMINTVENRFKYYLKHNVSNDLAYNVEFAINIKIPIYLKAKEFKKSVFYVLKDLYSQEQIIDFYNNSFHSSPQTFPPKLLYLEIENSTALYNAIYKLFNKRFKYVSKMSKLKQQFYSELRTNKVTRYDFMCVMYNAFPQIRDSYSKAKQSNPSLLLENYLLNKSRNIRA